MNPCHANRTRLGATSDGFMKPTALSREMREILKHEKIFIAFETQ